MNLMAKKYIKPQILVLEMESEEPLNASYSTGDRIQSYGVTGGGIGNYNQDTESKNRVVGMGDDDDEW